MKLNLITFKEALASLGRGKEGVRNHFLKHRSSYQRAGLVFLLLAILLTGTVGGYLYADRRAKEKLFQKDIYLGFLSEVYDTTKENYWEKTTDKQLTELFKLGAEKITGQAQILEKADRSGLKQMALIAMKDMDAEQKKEFVTQLANLVLVNLKPFGRSQLYSQKEETQLRETVANVNPQTGKIESTVFAQTLAPDIVLLRMTKLSPQTFEEFQKVTAEVDKTSRASSLILDLRGNVGGAIDLLQYFLGPFIGQGQSAYDFFHQGDYKSFKTQVGWLPALVRYKKVVILVDGQTQSSAELMASVLKKYNVGVLVGSTTKGWGTVENTFSLKNQLDLREKYSLFLAHSLTLREDNQPIEGRGVDPLVDIANPGWPQELFVYLHYQELVDVVKTVLKTK